VVEATFLILLVCLFFSLIGNLSDVLGPHSCPPSAVNFLSITVLLFNIVADKGYVCALVRFRALPFFFRSLFYLCSGVLFRCNLFVT